MRYLLDTNIALRLINIADRQYPEIQEAIATLLEERHECYLTSQVLIELWVVATRPKDVNGLGCSVDSIRRAINELRESFPLLEENAQILPIWLELVTTHTLKGKRVHDARLAAVALSAGISHILTLNPRDFRGIAGIYPISPLEL